MQIPDDTTFIEQVQVTVTDTYRHFHPVSTPEVHVSGSGPKGLHINVIRLTNVSQVQSPSFGVANLVCLSWLFVARVSVRSFACTLVDIT